jgi:hypothetical protein
MVGMLRTKTLLMLVPNRILILTLSARAQHYLQMLGHLP